MATRRQERTPLIGARQAPPQHDPYSPSMEDFDKTDRRPMMGRVNAALSSMFSPVNSTPRAVRTRRTPEKKQDEKEDYYEDTFNDYPWRCTFGTREDDGIWMNRKDQAGVIMSFLVWVLIVYSGITVTLLAHNNHLPGILAMLYCTICALALASHAKTTFTDPGAIPLSAVPRATLPTNTMHAMCSHCQTYKPPASHHCRICNRCISKMDHHCPWMNNCVGIGNLKHFILFLAYTWIGAVFALLIFAWNYFLCASDSCVFSLVLIQLVRAMTFLSIGAFLFTSSMIMNVTYGVMTGIGTIDRLKKKATNTTLMSDDEPVPLEDIFGIGGYWTWWLPIDPVFEDYDRVLGYSTPQRLLREHHRDTPIDSPGMDSKGYSQV